MEPDTFNAIKNISMEKKLKINVYEKFSIYYERLNYTKFTMKHFKLLKSVVLRSNNNFLLSITNEQITIIKRSQRIMLNVYYTFCEYILVNSVRQIF